MRSKTPPLLSEIERLRSELAKANETIKNVSFNENPDIFCIRKDSDRFFGRVMVTAAIALLKTQEENPKTLINFGYEVVENGKN